MKRVLMLVLLFVFASLFACVKRTPEPEDEAGFDQTPPDAVVVLVLDVSGSFESKLLTQDYRAFKFVTHLLEQLYEQGVGSTSRLQISLISGSATPIFFDGTFRDFGKRFSEGDEFRKTLLRVRDNNGSRVHDSISDSIDFALKNNRIQAGKTRLGLFVLSDFEDNFGDTLSIPRLKTALEKWAQYQGLVGFYWVDQRYYARWSGIFSEIYTKAGCPNRATISIAETDTPSIPRVFKP